MFLPNCWWRLMMWAGALQCIQFATTISSDRLDWTSTVRFLDLLDRWIPQMITELKKSLFWVLQHVKLSTTYPVTKILMKKPTNRVQDMLMATCRQSERSCEEFVKVAMLECSEWIRSSFILAHKVRRQKHRTDRTYKTKWTDCGVRIWTTCQRKKHRVQKQTGGKETT